MSIVDNGDAIYFMSEPYGSQGRETALPHDTTGSATSSRTGCTFLQR